MVASRVEVTKNALEMLQDDRGGNGGGAAYESDADYGPQRTGSDTASPGEPVLSSPASRAEKFQKFRVRTYSTVTMIGGFILIIWMGHVPLMALIFTIQVLMCRELFKLARRGGSITGRPVAGTKFQQWYFFYTAAFWLYLRFVQRNLLVEITSNAQAARLLSWALRKHTFISYALYTAGFVQFVLRLKKGQYLEQFGQYAWTHMILLVVFIPTSFFVSNIFDGLIWFLLPCALVIINDIGAYLVGIVVGRTPLIKLSPKKTWEGFIGGAAVTLFASWYLAAFMSRYQWMTCERNDLSMGWLRCDPDDMFKMHAYSGPAVWDQLPPVLQEVVRPFERALPAAVLSYLQRKVVHATPMQFHALVLSAFASLIAPFGGFFASGFKRGFKIKDFGDSIPGHGGMTDRMDCQARHFREVVMAVFSYLYLNNWAARHTVTVGYVLSKALELEPDQMLDFFAKMGNLLVGEEVLPERFLDDFTRLLRRYRVPVNDSFPILL